MIICTPWSKLKLFHFNPPIITLQRHPSIQKKYITHQKNLNIPLDQYLYEKIFTKNQDYSFQPNTFPYYLESNIEHWVLWWNPKKENSILDDKKWVEKIIEKNWCKKKYEYSCFENFTKDRSVQTIRHFQIFIKIK